MRTSRPGGRRYVLVPSLYIAVVATLLYIEFGGRQSTTESVGSAHVTSVVSKSIVGRDRVRELHIRYGSVQLRLTPSSQAGIEDRSGASQPLRQIEYLSSDTGLTVTLGNMVELRVLADERSMRVSAQLIGSLPAAVALSVPIGVDSRASMSIVSGLPLLRLSEAGRATFLSAPDGSLLDARHVRAAVEPGEPTAILVAERRPESDDPYRYWFSSAAAPDDPETCRAAVAAFLRSSYSTWQTQIATGAANPLTNGALSIAYLSEALAQGLLPQAVAALQPRAAALFTQGSQASDALAATFLGMPQLYLDGGRKQTALLAEEITRKLAASDASVFRVPRLPSVLLGQPSESALKQAITLADSVSVSEEDPNELLDVARFYADLDTTPGTALAGDGGTTRRLEQIVTERLIPCLRRTGSGVFFLPSPEAGEALDRTIVIGRLLLDVSGSPGREALAPVGRQCIVSALSLAGQSGTLPARIRLDGDRLISSAEPLQTEAVYPLLAQDRYLPREYPLPAALGPGASMLTAAVVSDLACNDATLTFSLAFPQWQTHYVIIQGLSSVRELQLHGMAWRPDPGYYQYTDGWWFDPATKTLFLKCTHQREVEKLVISAAR